MDALESKPTVFGQVGLGLRPGRAKGKDHGVSRGLSLRAIVLSRVTDIRVCYAGPLVTDVRLVSGWDTVSAAEVGPPMLLSGRWAAESRGWPVAAGLGFAFRAMVPHLWGA